MSYLPRGRISAFFFEDVGERPLVVAVERAARAVEPIEKPKLDAGRSLQSDKVARRERDLSYPVCVEEAY